MLTLDYRATAPVAHEGRYLTPEVSDEASLLFNDYTAVFRTSP